MAITYKIWDKQGTMIKEVTSIGAVAGGGGYIDFIDADSKVIYSINGSLISYIQIQGYSIATPDPTYSKGSKTYLITLADGEKVTVEYIKRTSFDGILNFIDYNGKVIYGFAYDEVLSMEVLKVN